MPESPNSRSLPEYMGQVEDVELLLTWLSNAGNDYAETGHRSDMNRWAASRAHHVIPKLLGRIADLEAAREHLLSIICGGHDGGYRPTSCAGCAAAIGVEL